MLPANHDCLSARLVVSLTGALSLFASATGYTGGYFRYGALSWQQTKIEDDGITVKFTLKTAWARGMFSRGAADTPWGNCLSCSIPATNPSRQCDNIPGTKLVQNSCFLPVAGDSVALYDVVDTTGLPIPNEALPPVETVFAFGDDPSTSLTGARMRTASKYKPRCREAADVAFGKCIEGTVVDSFGLELPGGGFQLPSPEEDARDITYVVSEIYHKYPKKTEAYNVEFVGCCRLGPMDAGDLINNPDGAWRLRNHVTVTDDPFLMATGTVASPIFSHTPFVTVPLNSPLSFQVHAFDAASRPVTYRIGDNDDFGVGLNEAAQEPFGNKVKITINPSTGVVTFPASVDTQYQAYYNLVVVATTVGPCELYDSTAEARRCSASGGKQQKQKVSAVVDFLIRVVDAGRTLGGSVFGVGSCDNFNSGLPPGSKVCNRQPLLVAPAERKFICSEHGSFQVTATDGTGVDKSISSPKGVFAIRHRQRVVLDTNYQAGECSVRAGGATRCMDDRDCEIKNRGNGTRTQHGPTCPHGDQGFWAPGNRAIAGSNSSEASATFSWTPLCEDPDADFMYSYQGRHRLGVFSACFVAVDQGGLEEREGKLTSPPKCTRMPVIRCTKPTLQHPTANRGIDKFFWSSPTWVVPVATNITISWTAKDDSQTKRLTIRHNVHHGIPSVGAEWKPATCSADSDLRVTCNPVQRNFYFEPHMIHAGTQITVCAEAVNDQAECPSYRKNNGAQAYGEHHSAPGLEMPPIMTSQACSF